jgi:hypothetical protein
MLAVAAIDAAAVAGAVVLAAAFLLTGPMVRDLERQARPRPDYARIRELERDLYGREFLRELEDRCAALEAQPEESPLARRDAYIGTWSGQDVTRRTEEPW